MMNYEVDALTGAMTGTLVLRKLQYLDSFQKRTTIPISYDVEEFKVAAAAGGGTEVISG